MVGHGLSKQEILGLAQSWPRNFEATISFCIKSRMHLLEMLPRGAVCTDTAPSTLVSSRPLHIPS
jgi:hypothetical protein